jgi:hypothetical protein
MAFDNTSLSTGMMSKFVGKFSSLELQLCLHQCSITPNFFLDVYYALFQGFMVIATDIDT